MANIKLGYAPTRRSIFSAPDALKYRGLTADRLRELGVDFVDKDSNLLIIINDNYADGRDVSWLWDAEFEVINNNKNEIVVSGIRANDMALRLKYAGVEKIKIINDIEKAVEYIGKTADNNITILPTYTALLKLNRMRILKKCY